MNTLLWLYSMFRYHVTCGIEKKIVTVDDKTTLNDVIQTQFGVSSCLLQSWDSEFEDWVNVTDVTQLPDKGKLQAVVKGGHQHQLFV